MSDVFVFPDDAGAIDEMRVNSAVFWLLRHGVEAAVVEEDGEFLLGLPTYTRPISRRSLVGRVLTSDGVFA